MAEKLEVQVDASRAQAGLDALSASITAVGTALIAVQATGAGAFTRIVNDLAALKGVDAGVSSAFQNISSALSGMNATISGLNFTPLGNLKTSINGIEASNITGTAAAFQALGVSFSNLHPENVERVKTAASGITATGVAGLATSFQQLGTAAGLSASQTTAAAAATAAVGTTAQAAAAGVGQTAAAMSQSATMTQGFVAALGAVGGGIAAATGQLGGLGVAINNTVTGFHALSGAGFPPGIAAGIALAVSAVAMLVASLPMLLGSIIDVNNQFISFMNTMDAIRGQGAGALALENLQGIAARTSTDVLILTKNFAGFDAAAKGMGITTQQTNKMFEQLSGAMLVMGVSGIKAERVMSAFAQMASKGKVSMEELKQQMGEAMPLAIQAMANALGTSVAQMTKLLEAGAVSSTILPRFTDEMLKLAGGADAVARAGVTVAAQMTALNNNFSALANSFGQGINLGFMAQLASGLKSVNDAMDNSGFKVFAAAMGDLAGVIGNALLTALGGALQVLSLFAGVIGSALAVATGFIRVVMDIANAFLQWSFIQQLLSSFTATFASVFTAVSTIVGIVTSAAKSFADWFASLTSGQGLLSGFASTISVISGVLTSIFSIFGDGAGTILGFGAAMAAAGVIITVLSSAFGILSGLMTAALPTYLGLAAGTSVWTLATGAAAVAMGVLKGAMLALVSTPLGLTLTALAAGAWALYTIFPQVSTAVDNAGRSFTAWTQSIINTKTSTSEFQASIGRIVPSISQLEATLSKTLDTVGKQAEAIGRLSSGISEFDQSADGMKIKMDALDEATRKGTESLHLHEAGINRVKEANTSAEGSIQSQLTRLQSLSQQWKTTGSTVDLYGDKITRLKSTLSAVKDADEAQIGRLQKQKTAYNETGKAIDDQRARLKQMQDSLKEYGAVLSESEVAMTKQLQSLGLVKADSVLVAQGYTVMQAGIEGLMESVAREIEAKTKSRDALMSYLAAAKEQVTVINASRNALGELVPAQALLMQSTKSVIDVLERNVSSINAQIGANRVLELTMVKGVTTGDAYAQAFAELGDEAKQAVGGMEGFTQQVSKQIEKDIEAKAATSGLGDATKTAADKAKEAATEISKISASMTAISTNSAPAKTGVDAVAASLEKVKEPVATTVTSFQNLGTQFTTMSTTTPQVATALDSIKISLDGVATNSLVTTDGLTKIGTALAPISMSASEAASGLTNIKAATDGLIVTLPATGVGLTAIGVSLTSIGTALTTVDFAPLATSLTGLMVSAPPVGAAFGTIGTAFASIAPAMLVITEGFTVVNTQLTALTTIIPGFAANWTTIATDSNSLQVSLPVIGATLQGMSVSMPLVATASSGIVTALNAMGPAAENITKVSEAFDGIIAKLATLKTAFEEFKTSVETAVKAASDIIRLELPAAALVADTAVGNMAANMRSALDSLQAKIRETIALLAQLAAAQNAADSGAGGTPGGRTGGLTNVPSSFQSSHSVPSAMWNSAPQLRSGTDNTNSLTRRLPGGGIPTVLHPNEAVIPLPNGRSVPVEFTKPSEGMAALVSAVQNLANTQASFLASDDGRGSNGTTIARSFGPGDLNNSSGPILGGGGGLGADSGIVARVFSQAAMALSEARAVSPPPVPQPVVQNDPTARVANTFTPSAARPPEDRSPARDPPINIVFNITTPDADSFRRSEPQVRAAAYRGMREAYARNR